MTPSASLSSPYEERIAPSSRIVAALMTMALLPGASSLATMMLLTERWEARLGIPSATLGFPQVI